MWLIVGVKMTLNVAGTGVVRHHLEAKLTGDPNDVGLLTQLALLEEAQGLDGDALETLLREGCSG